MRLSGITFLLVIFKLTKWQSFTLWLKFRSWRCTPVLRCHQWPAYSSRSTEKSKIFWFRHIPSDINEFLITSGIKSLSFKYCTVDLHRFFSTLGKNYGERRRIHFLKFNNGSKIEVKHNLTKHNWQWIRKFLLNIDMNARWPKLTH